MRQSKNKIILYAVIAVLGLAGAGFFAIGKFQGDFGSKDSQPALTLGESGNSSGGETPPSSLKPGADEKTPSVPESGGELSQTYTDEKYAFSFKYPEGFNITNFFDETGDTVLLQKPGAEEGFQVFVSVFDEPAGELSPERIQADLPDMVIKNPQQVVIAGGRIPAWVFNSEDQVVGQTREVWLVWPPEPLPHGNYLYQISAYADLDALLGSILETWSF